VNSFLKKEKGEGRTFNCLTERIKGEWLSTLYNEEGGERGGGAEDTLQVISKGGREKSGARVL